ncbi:Myb-related protein B [Apiospora arundinis]|uniref:Myb-related protein B n=1 Tax=Apiospora arundinis TaxID=335852 RepID=A0ABR2IVJ8_9PEZI
MAKHPKKWTVQEDEALLEQVKQRRLPTHQTAGSIMSWNNVAQYFPGRSNKDCRKRWCKLETKDPEGRRKGGTWDQDEDQRLMEAVGAVGKKWTSVSERVGSRNADQCAKRWQHCLDPSLKRSEWTPEEDAHLLAAVSSAPDNMVPWKSLSEKLPGRSTTSMKNRHTALIRQRASETSSEGQAGLQPSCTSWGPSQDLELVAGHHAGLLDQETQMDGRPELNDYNAFGNGNADFTKDLDQFSLVDSLFSPSSIETAIRFDDSVDAQLSSASFSPTSFWPHSDAPSVDISPDSTGMLDLPDQDEIWATLNRLGPDAASRGSELESQGPQVAMDLQLVNASISTEARNQRDIKKVMEEVERRVSADVSQTIFILDRPEGEMLCDLMRVLANGKSQVTILMNK